MKFIISALFVVAACLSGTFAQQPCVIVDPTFESTWPIGSTQLISWTNAVFTTLDVYLDDGSSSDYHINLPAIINNLPVSPNYYYFIVPSILAGAPITVPGTYAIQFGIAPNVAYGGPVIITAPDGVVQTTPAPPPPGSSVPIVSVSRVNSSALANVSSPAPPTSASTQLFQDTLVTLTTTSTSSSSSTAAPTTTSTSKSAGSSLSPLSLGSLIAALSFGLFNL